MVRPLWDALFAIGVGDAVGGGTWTSTNPAVAAIGSLSGIVSGLTLGTSFEPRPAIIAPSTSTAMIAQVVTTPDVIGTGPRWKRGTLLSGEIIKR